MAMDIFSNFDPSWFNMCIKSGLAALMPLIMLSLMYWCNKNTYIISSTLPVSYMKTQLMTTKTPFLKGLSDFIIMVFLFLMLINLQGMIPYLFSITSHIIFTFSIGFPLWSAMILTSLTFSMKRTSAHLLPDGAPLWLNPFLVIIETISISVRPITLSFRLAANMTAGHVVLSLMSSFSISHSPYNLLLLIFITTGYIIFELAICLIQAYIFCLLLSLYSNEHS